VPGEDTLVFVEAHPDLMQTFGLALAVIPLIDHHWHELFN